MKNNMNDMPSNKFALYEAYRYAISNSPFYKRKLNNIKFNTEEELIENWSSIPTTSKSELANYNSDFLAVPINQVADYATTSGTTGNPVTIFQTRADLKRLSQNEYDALSLVGIKKGDLIQLMTTIDRQFIAGLAYFHGVQQLEAGIIRMGPGLPALQFDAIQRYKPGYIIAVPSFITTLIQYAETNLINLNDLSVHTIVCIGEPVRDQNFELNTLGKKIESSWPVKLFSTYASTEIATAFTECFIHRGCHSNNNLLYLEVLDDEGNEVCDGDIGEIVITPLGITGTPLIRYRTGDMAKRYSQPCSCGRNSPRLGPIVGRKHQMIKFKGTTIYPQAIFDIFDEIEEVQCYKINITRDDYGNDIINVMLDNKINSTSSINKIKEYCQSKIKVTPNLLFCSTNELHDMVFKKNARKPEKISYF